MLSKPVIQYVVEEALEPEGVDGVIIVNSHEKAGPGKCAFGQGQKRRVRLASGRARPQRQLLYGKIVRRRAVKLRR